jgi:lambda family phage portal protein
VDELGYRAPRDKNSAGGWVPSGGATQEHAAAALPLIRARSRDLAQNNPHALRAVSTLTSHSVGIGIRASIKGDTDFEESFNSWASSTLADQEKRMNFYGVQNLATRTMFEAGDSLIIMRDKRTPDGLRLTLQVIDPEQFDTGAAPKYKENKVHQGVEVYPSGQIAGYHVRLSLDDTKSVFVPIRDAVQMMEIVYPGQVRGIPRGAQVLVRAKHADDLMAVWLTQARISACLTAFITTPAASSAPTMIGAEMEDDGGYLAPEAVEPGMIVPLNPGEDVRTTQPPASGGLKDFSDISLRSVAVGYGVMEYHVSGNLSGFTYSSGKFGLNEFYASIDSLREHTIKPGLLKIIDRFRQTYEANEGRSVNATYTLISPKRTSVEPLKDAQATNLRLQNGTLSRRLKLIQKQSPSWSRLVEFASVRKPSKQKSRPQMTTQFL